MAYTGYLAVGLEDTETGSRALEIVNTSRALAYANAVGGLTWLLNCDECPDVNEVVPDGGDYHAPWSDPAPWFTPNKPDSAGFLGVIGLEFDGIDSSTRYSNVQRTINPTVGGSIGVTYEGPRVITVRALAVADAECSLSYGLRWLNEQWLVSWNACQGDPLTFFECCADARCDEGENYPVGPCWPDTYAQLAAGPSCSPDWWPATYGDLAAGPPYLRNETGGGDWCDWVGVYRELKAWLPPWNCCYELRVIPRWKSMRHARVTAGPTVLRRIPVSIGALAEIEIEITCGDPTAERMPYYWPDTFSTFDTWVTRPARSA